MSSRIYKYSSGFQYLSRPTLRTPAKARFLLTRTIMTNGVSDAIKTDHRELEEYYDNILRSTTDDEKVRWQNQFTWELARHSIAEELVVYPAMEKHLSDGKDLADRDRKEHQTAKEELKKFQQMQPNDANFLPTIQNLMSNLRQHIKEEEEEDLVKLEGALQEDESQSLSNSFERTKMLVPSRSHPMAPDKPPFETAVGLMTAPIDKVADIFRKFPQNA